MTALTDLAWNVVMGVEGMRVRNLEVALAQLRPLCRLSATTVCVVLVRYTYIYIYI